MAWDDDDEEELEADDDGATGALTLAEWLTERYDGDERVETVDQLDPGPLEGEAVRVRMLLNAQTYFFVSVLEDEAVVRVGLATEDEELSKEIEEAATSEAGSLNDFLLAAMEDGDELEYEVTHFHDDVFYFSSEIPFQRESDLTSRHMKENLLLYLEGYITAIQELIEGAGDDEDDDE